MKIRGIIATTILVIFVYLFFIGLGWITTCGIIKLITMCFGLNFSWAIATGIFLIMYIIKMIFSSSGGK